MKFDKDTIKDLRLQKGMSQLEFARSIGSSRNMVTRWESGDHTPGTEYLAKICRVHNVTIDFFFAENDVCTQHKNNCEVKQ